MPGLSLLVSPKIRDTELAACRKAIAGMCHDADYLAETIYNSNSAFLGFTAYPEYPRSVLDLTNHIVLVEGAIYDLAERDLNSELELVARWCDDGDSEIDDGRISRWLMERDGPFVIVVISKRTGEVAILPDALSQLPLFHCFEKGQLMVGREHKFIVSVTGRLLIDPIGAAEQLIYGFPLHSRTHNANISRLLPGTALRFKPGDNAPRILTYWQWRMARSQASTPVAETAGKLADRFREATTRRVEWRKGDKTVVGLSGGMDSRCVLAGLAAVADNIHTVTSLDFDEANRYDVTVAAEVAEFMRTNHITFKVHNPTIDRMLEFSLAKDGINSIAMAGSLELYEIVREKFGRRLTYYTGDGGEAVKTSRLPEQAFSNINDMLNLTMIAPRILDIDICAELFGIAPADLYTASIETFDSFPEEDYDLKFARFMLLDRENRYFMEGQDRNRIGFWTASQFYSLPVFLTLMNIPDHYKKRFGLIKCFLAALKPGSEKIKYADLKVPITSVWARIVPQMRLWMSSKPVIRKIGRRLLVRGAYGTYKDEQLVDALVRLASESQLVNEQLNSSVLTKLLAGRLNKMQLMNIGTLIMYMHEQERMLKS
ncbi:MAG: hypothetical protein KKH67_09470 [candidate division Zixibacteria bacterium]|nr:hypothetical protein [candidate division Zixibacteria bacterium]MBU1471145.1 hypothetical protein [candidate division Zixibacteria bacterium]